MGYRNLAPFELVFFQRLGLRQRFAKFSNEVLMKSLSSRQEQVLRFLIDFNAEHGFPPTIRELCHHFGFKSLNTAHFHLRSLKKKGYIQIHPGKGRGITLSGKYLQPGRKIPIVGRIAAGKPLLALENIEEFLGIDKHFFGAGASFAVHVKGDSMIGAHIQEGDYVIIKIQDQAENGDIVAALIDDEVTLKYFYRTESEIKLKSANPAYTPLVFKKGDTLSLKILGVMIGLLRKK
ncbi:MAG: repressor LexA [Deltaproteobacteria bacterium]|nr:MAG: repressor LexA [Deltaproteobacteria bacterium]RLB94588.1 MAG: repressor LexA [Deltaproteobacteria bacterium]